MFRVRRGLVAPLVPGTKAMRPHQSLDPFLAGRETPYPQFPNHPGAAIGALEFGMDGLDQGDHLGVGQTLARRCAALLPGAIAANADRQGVGHRREAEFRVMRLHPGVLHSTSLAKYAVAFF